MRLIARGGRRMEGDSMTFFFQLLFNGIALGSIYALTAIGYSLVYGVLELVNFAHGSVYMLGAFMYFVFVGLLGMPWWLSLPLSLVLTGLIGIFYDTVALKPLRKVNAPKYTGLICTMGISIIIQNLVFIFFGSDTRLYPTFFNGQFISFGGFTFSYMSLLIIGVSAVALVLLTLFIKETKTGIALRGVAQNAEAAGIMGVNVNRMIALTFFIGSAMAALSGIFSCMSFRGVDITVGVKIAIKAFAATVLGGMGNLGGAVLGAFIIAIAETYTAGYFSSDMRDLASFVILILILFVRPNGLLGKPVQKKV